MKGLKRSRTSSCDSMLYVSPQCFAGWSVVLFGLGMALYLSIATQAAAEVRLPSVLTEHMVLQRDRPIHIWGQADPGEAVRVSFHGTETSGKADELGRWGVYLSPQNAGGPYTLTITGKNRIQFVDILVGDVWLASGQSNMEFPMARNAPWSDGTQDYEREIAAATVPQMRLFQVKAATSSFPKDDVTSKQEWTRCSPATVASFSAVAYYFGRELTEKEQIPIGLIESSVGGTPAEAWTSADALTSDPALMPVFEARAHMMDGHAAGLLQERAEQLEDERAKVTNKPAREHAWRPDVNTWEPASLFNAIIAPLTPMPIRGVIWYQGESNTDRARASVYARLFPAMIADWRQRWSEPNLPFLYVQIANYISPDDWPTVREAQRRTLFVRDTGMAVTIDIGNPRMIHPTDKKDVGHRLALWARAITYGEAIEDSGPLFRQATPEGQRMRIYFDHAGDGLSSRGRSLRAFEVSGEDRKFFPATATISDDTVIVSNVDVPKPRFVRYGWSAAPECNLYNGSGLPASPFTSLP